MTLSNFLKRLSPDFKIPETFAPLKDKSIGTLNLLLKLTYDLYQVSKENIGEISEALIHVMNFYMCQKDSTSWSTIALGFTSLCLSLFKLDMVENAASHIARIIALFMKRLRSYFVKAESAEKEVKSFWTDITVTNPRTLFGMVSSFSGIMTSIICLKNFVDKTFSEGDIYNLISEVSSGIFKVGSEVRQHAENITVFLARVFDWVYLNSEALMKLQFDKIAWELPSDQVFESKYVELVSLLNKIEQDPLYLETNNLTYSILRARLYRLRESGEKELNKSPAPSVRSAIARYLLIIDEKIGLVESRLNPDNTKPQPLSITLIGSAGCGKSSASDKLGALIQAITGRATDDSLINNRGGDPKFEENITGSTDVIVYDDYANDQSKKLATKEVLDIVNTTKEIIPKADVNEKGNHKYSNSGAIFTTNDENVGIRCFKTASVESLLRRLGICAFLGIQEEFRLLDTDRLDLNHPKVKGENFNTDVYTVALKRPRGVFIDAYGNQTVEYTDIEVPHKPGNNEWRDAVCELQRIWIAEWADSVRRHERSKAKTDQCEVCTLSPDMCLCEVREEISPKGSASGVVPLCEEVTSTQELTAESLSSTGIKFKSMFFDQPVASAQQKFYSLDHSVLDFSSVLAAKLSLFIYYKTVIAYFLERADFYITNYVTFLSLLLILCMIPFGPVILIGAIVTWEYRYLTTAKTERFERDLQLGVAIIESKKLRYATYGVVFCTGALTLTALFKSLITVTKIVLTSEEATQQYPIVEDAFVPAEEQVDFSPPKEKSNSDAIGHFLRFPRPAHEARSTRPCDVIREIGKGLQEVKISSGGTVVSTVKCLPFGSERLIPRHALAKEGLMDVHISQMGTTSSYKNADVPQTHVSVLCKRQFLKSKILDAALVHLPNAPPGKDFTKYLAEPNTLPGCAGCTYIHKNCQTGDYEEIEIRARLLSRPINYLSAHGPEQQYVYECTAQYHQSSEGDCGQPLIYKNSIIGIHIAGDCSNVFYCLAIDKSTVECANRVLKQEASIFVASTPSDPVLKSNLKGLQIIDEPTSYVTDVLGASHTPIVSLGTVLDVSSNLYRPRAEDYYFRNGNHQIEAEFGELSSRPPKFVNGVTQINTTLLKFNTPKMLVPISLMDRASKDYVYKPNLSGKTLSGYARDLEKASPGFFAVRSLQEALDGDATGVVRGMNNNTSSGVCYGGKKTKHMVLTPLGDAVVPRELVDYVEEDILHLESEWRAGRGTFDPFVRASKTNEVLPLKKAYEKTRSVYGNDMSFFIAATRGIIPLKHVLRNMEMSECYVGLAAQSTEWAKLHDYVTNGGEYTNFVCGDFSGYDTQLPKALLEKAAAIILTMYRENGASESDIEYLRGFLSSVVSPTMIWEGNLLQFCSGQPSGQPLTVEMNSTVNSLLIRMAFFVIMDLHYPEIKDPNFRLFVKLAVYGDDNLMGVSSRIPLFNHTTIQAVFASWGIKYTMADKDADSVPYLSIGEVSFLKRSFFHHEELDAIVAPIEEESLSKKIYWWTKSKNTPLSFEEQYAANFESQAREAYLHGVEFYSEFCAKCERIVAASSEGATDFVLPWSTIQPISPAKMKSMLYDAYHVNKKLDEETYVSE
eukprot:NODE_2_length_7052_cov_8.632872_g1_i0.p1 GENE.NODE_2_length_7052_cov_8.632872_g1_i0~~NODE_2_length_7052_cov_8.632872_g1_i0.p1  ORF type:complete len:1604 (+),score=18.45 NODE_2_length_7052_cov_8.632872_g1_i0:1773-6584(+)